MAGGAVDAKLRGLRHNLGLLLAAVAVCFAAIETGYRLLDPFPYLDATALASSQAASLGRYDPELGWSGMPGAKGYVVTNNRRVWMEFNRLGFRDIEHDTAPAAPALVLLGDSHTEGHEVEFEEMFPTLLRRRLPQYEIHVLARAGWATDQEYLAFKRWRTRDRVERVVLMLCFNDIGDNNASFGSRAKPQFLLQHGQLVLTNVPVPQAESPEVIMDEGAPHWAPLKSLLYRSYFLHDIGFRLGLAKQVKTRVKRAAAPDDTSVAMTLRLVDLLRSEVSSRGGSLLVVATPSLAELMGRRREPPYQQGIEDGCRQLGIEYLDLAPSFKRSWLRTHYRFGEHWTPHGHEIVAEALHEALTS